MQPLRLLAMHCPAAHQNSGDAQDWAALLKVAKEEGFQTQSSVVFAVHMLPPAVVAIVTPVDGYDAVSALRAAGASSSLHPRHRDPQLHPFEAEAEAEAEVGVVGVSQCLLGPLYLAHLREQSALENRTRTSS